MDSLSTAKMLLGIKDNEQDDLLSFLIDDMENLINSYCHTAEVPTKLQSLVPQPVPLSLVTVAAMDV